MDIEKNDTQYDNVNKPKHYNCFYAMEVIDIVKQMLTPEEFKGYLKGNILKYRLRAGLKGGPEVREEDLNKSNYYQDKYFRDIGTP